MEKQNLVAATVQDVAVLREREFRFYVDHIGAIQTLATLMAGFSFTALLSSEQVKLDWYSFSLQRATGQFEEVIVNETTGKLVSSPIYQTPDFFGIYSMTMNILGMICMVVCLGEMLTVMAESLIARLLGSRLALRGPDGSIIEATRHLATNLTSCTRHFFNGLTYFVLATAFHVLRTQHIVIGFVLVGILLPYWQNQVVLADTLSRKFHLVRGVTTAFNAQLSDAPATETPCRSATRRGPRFFSPGTSSPRTTPAASPGPSRHTEGSRPHRVRLEGFRQRMERRRSSDLSSPVNFPPPKPPASTPDAREAAEAGTTPAGSSDSSSAAGAAPRAAFARARERNSSARFSSGEMRTDSIRHAVKGARATFQSRLTKIIRTIDPVSHRLNLLFAQVAEDFEGEGKAANKAHRVPTAATKHLIYSSEAMQQEIQRALDADNQMYQTDRGDLLESFAANMDPLSGGNWLVQRKTAGRPLADDSSAAGEIHNPFDIMNKTVQRLQSGSWLDALGSSQTSTPPAVASQGSLHKPEHRESCDDPFALDDATPSRQMSRSFPAASGREKRYSSDPSVLGEFSFSAQSDASGPTPPPTDHKQSSLTKFMA